MDDKFYVVRFSGPFGFIKPWTAVRDSETYSQQFLTPSIVEGMRQKLGVSFILRHRITHRGFDLQQERTQAAGYALKVVKARRQATYDRPMSILTRGVMMAPSLHLAFPSAQDAERAIRQHLCLCRNEDLVFPDDVIEAMHPNDFDQLDGYELHFETGPETFMVGYNRFDDSAPMYGRLSVTGNPIKDDLLEL